MLDRIRIVLVSPSSPGNVGSVCRAMANMGLTDLVVVAPRCDPTCDEAAAFAAHGTRVFQRLRVVEDIRLALADSVRSYATTSKLGLYRRQAAIAPDEAGDETMRLIAATASSDATRVVFAFGREDYGFKTGELLHFDRVVTIPADETYPVMNLAAAVTVCCYELRRAWLRGSGQPALAMAIEGEPARGEQKDVLFEKLFDALERVGFLWGQSPDHLKYALRHMLGRIDLSVNEADILIGLARQIRWYVDHYPRTGRRGETPDRS